MKRSLLMAVGIVAASMTVGCMSGVYDGYQHNGPGNSFSAPLNLSGHASKPNAVIQIQAYHQRNRSWDVVALARSSARATNYGGETMYEWKYSFVVNDELNSSCYVSPDNRCQVRPGQTPMKLRFREVGGKISFLMTFDEGGVACLTQKVGQGQTLVNAAASCKGLNSPVVTIQLGN